MTHDPHSFLLDLLSADPLAGAQGSGLDPRLLELLAERHAHHPGVTRLPLPIRHDGPADVRR